MIVTRCVTYDAVASGGPVAITNRPDEPDVDVYQEWAPPASLRSWVRCLWVRHTSEAHGRSVPVLPDGCTDLMWMDGSLQVAGPDRVVNPAWCPPGGRIVGVRFHPGRLGPLVMPDLVELADRRVTLEDVFPGDVRRLTDRLGEAAARSSQDIARGLLREVADRVADAEQPDHLVTTVVAACDQAGGAVGLRMLAADLHMSERQLRRRCHRALGYGPKTLHRILRFQRFLRLAERAPAGHLATLATTAGYADQSHLTRECQRLAGTSPTTLLASRVLR